MKEIKHQKPVLNEADTQRGAKYQPIRGELAIPSERTDKREVPSEIVEIEQRAQTLWSIIASINSSEKNIDKIDCEKLHSFN